MGHAIMPAPRAHEEARVVVLPHTASTHKLHRRASMLLDVSVAITVLARSSFDTHDVRVPNAVEALHLGCLHSFLGAHRALG